MGSLSSTANYIVPPYERADFRYDFTSPGGKSASSAQILITGDNNYTLWVNGELIGGGNDWQTSQSYCVALNPINNVFAAETVNFPPNNNPSAFISAIQVNFVGGSSQIIVSDASWRANNATTGFQSPSFDDSNWPHAVIVGNANSAPWHVPYPQPPASSLSISNSYWIWTNEISSPGGNAPIGHRAFRKTIDLPGGVLTRSGTIVISVDNGYTLYINGKQIGSAGDWTHAQRWKFTLDYPTDDIVIAVDAVNTGGPAGLIAAVEFDVANCDGCSSYLVYISDSSWKYNLGVPAGFQQPDYNDCNWPNAVQEGLYGVAPWGSIPTVNGN
ncbi:hypothetical protein AX15_005908 [Amanita polypyramis BW_CC]|nr:hypothetical protein AX15_005908 [Amanita polypyramis BW_CC]